MNIKDKVIIVTGASSGIGEATAKLLSKKGAKVVLAARSKDKLNTLSKQLPHSLAIQTDVTDAKQIKQLIKKTIDHFGKIDVLINNAGRGYHVPIMQIKPEKFRELFTLDVLAPLILMQEVIPFMKKQGEGVIVNISSGTSLMTIYGIGAYSSLKRALNGISLTAREELKDDNISVSLVYPYITKTNFHKNLLNNSTWDMQRDDDMEEFDTPEHVAEKILEAIESGKAEIFAHDWMGKTRE
jgi:short-subunit dehydrogenase